MLPLIQDKAWQPTPSNVRAAGASKQRDYTTHTAEIQTAERSRKHNGKIEFIAATWEFLTGDFSLKQKKKKWN